MFSHSHAELKLPTVAYNGQKTDQTFMLSFLETQFWQLIAWALSPVAFHYALLPGTCLHNACEQFPLYSKAKCLGCYLKVIIYYSIISVQCVQNMLRQDILLGKIAG